MNYTVSAKLIQKYKKYSVAQLKTKAQTAFNKWIRERDKGLPCINCGKFRPLQAGHLFPTSTYPHLRFSEWNTNGECLQCNYFNSQSHAYGYRVNLIKKIGIENFEALEMFSKLRGKGKLSRFDYIDVILKYKC